MKFAKNIKWQLVLAALGFSLLLAARGNSQEIVNTDFATPATSVGGNFNNAVPADIYNTAAGAPQSVYTPVNALSLRATNDMQQLNAPSVPREAGMFLALAILIICWAAMKKVTSNRHGDARNNWNSSARPQRLPSRKPQPIHS